VRRFIGQKTDVDYEHVGEVAEINPALVKL
jgi:acetylglutamate kinase